MTWKPIDLVEPRVGALIRVTVGDRAAIYRVIRLYPDERRVDVEEMGTSAFADIPSLLTRWLWLRSAWSSGIVTSVDAAIPSCPKRGCYD